MRFRATDKTLKPMGTSTFAPEHKKTVAPHERHFLPGASTGDSVPERMKFSTHRAKLDS
jgi:hypothetical protein